MEGPGKAATEQHSARQHIAPKGEVWARSHLGPEYSYGNPFRYIERTSSLFKHLEDGSAREASRLCIADDPDGG